MAGGNGEHRIERLRQAGFSESQARAIVDVVEGAVLRDFEAYAEFLERRGAPAEQRLVRALDERHRRIVRRFAGWLLRLLLVLVLIGAAFWALMQFV